MDAYYRSPIEFQLSDSDPTATVSTAIPGQTTRSAGGETIVFTPSQPLEPSTEYTVTLDYCGGSAPLSFRTSELGEPVSAASLAGKTYSLDFSSGRFIEPAGVGAVLSTSLFQDMLLGVQRADSRSIQFLGAVGESGASPASQDYCEPTSSYPSASFSEAPFFSVGPADLQLRAGGFGVTIDRFTLSGTFASDGASFGGGMATGSLDTRPLDPLVGDQEGAVCTLSLSFGVFCEPCPSDGEPYCLDLVVDQIVGSSANGPVREVAGADCSGCYSWTPSTVPDLSRQSCPG